MEAVRVYSGQTVPFASVDGAYTLCPKSSRNQSSRRPESLCRSEVFGDFLGKCICVLFATTLRCPSRHRSTTFARAAEPSSRMMIECAAMPKSVRFGLQAVPAGFFVSPRHYGILGANLLRQELSCLTQGEKSPTHPLIW